MARKYPEVLMDEDSSVETKKDDCGTQTYDPADSESDEIAVVDRERELNTNDCFEDCDSDSGEDTDVFHDFDDE